MSWFTYQQSLEQLNESRKESEGTTLSFGVPYLDEALGGLPRSSLLLLGARTGVGKTQLVTQIAHANAAAGKRVHFFALEAEPHEIQGRMKYQMLAAYWYSRPELRAVHKDISLSYLAWHSGKYQDRFEVIEKEIDAFLQPAYANLTTYYRDNNDFTVPWFKSQFESIRHKTDLVIVDHLHYFDFDDESENRALKGAMKAIRDCALLSQKPVILVAHLRKRDRGSNGLMPELDDFHGSSDLTKIATDVVLLAPSSIGGSNGHWSTLMRVAKCRRDGSRNRYMGITSFSTAEMKYDDKYLLSKYFEGQEDLEIIESRSELPDWAVSANVPPMNAPRPSRNMSRKDYSRD